MRREASFGVVLPDRLSLFTCAQVGESPRCRLLPVHDVADVAVVVIAVVEIVVDMVAVIVIAIVAVAVAVAFPVVVVAGNVHMGLLKVAFSH